MSTALDSTDQSSRELAKPPREGFQLRRWGKLAQKELRETLRDRRTLFTLIMMPLLVYPLLGVILQKFLFSSLAGQVPQEFRVALDSETAAAELSRRLKAGSALLERTPQTDQQQSPATFGPLDANSAAAASYPSDFANTVSSVPAKRQDSPNSQPLVAPSAKKDFTPQVNLVVPNEPGQLTAERLVLAGNADVGVRFWRPGEKPGQLTEQIELIYSPASPRSLQAKNYLEERLQALAEGNLQARLAARPELRDVLPPVLKPRALASSGSSGYAIQTLLPLVLILTTITGAVYPAIDLTAGERERGTLETLIATPLPREEILAAKFVAVFVVGALTSLVNLVAMVSTIYGVGLQDLLFGGVPPSAWLLPQSFGILCLFALFFAALLLSVTSLARSFKEAQAYVIPLFLVAITPGIAALAPGMHLTLGLAFVPVMNLVLLSKDLLAGHLTAPSVAVALISTLVYGGVGLSRAARVFGKDAAGGSEEFLLFRRPSSWGNAPTFAHTWQLFVAVLPVLVLCSRLPTALGGATLEGKLIAGMVVQCGLFLGAIAVGLWRDKARPGPALALTQSSVWAYPIAAGLAACLWPTAYELTLLGTSANLQSLLDRYQSYVAALGAVSWQLRALGLAVVPACCEELFFRGFLFTGFQQRLRPAMNIVVTAFLFGALHVITPDSLGMLRFLPSTFLGLVLGYLRYRTGSLLPGLCLHLLHNLLMVSQDTFPTLLSALGLNLARAEHIPMKVLLATQGISVLLLAALSLMRGSRQAVPSVKSDALPAAMETPADNIAVRES